MRNVIGIGCFDIGNKYIYIDNKCSNIGNESTNIDVCFEEGILKYRKSERKSYFQFFI